MALIDFEQARDYVIVAITGFGGDFSVYAQHQPNVNVGALDSPPVLKPNGDKYTMPINYAGDEVWNYGISAHQITAPDSARLIQWFEQQYVGGKGLKEKLKQYEGAAAQQYGGWVVNLVWRKSEGGQSRLFNFHVKLAYESVFPSLSESMASLKKGK